MTVINVLCINIAVLGFVDVYTQEPPCLVSLNDLALDNFIMYLKVQLIYHLTSIIFRLVFCPVNFPMYFYRFVAVPFLFQYSCKSYRRKNISSLTLSIITRWGMVQWYLDAETNNCIFLKSQRLRTDGSVGEVVDCVLNMKAVACPQKTGSTFILVSLHAHRNARAQSSRHHCCILPARS